MPDRSRGQDQPEHEEPFPELFTVLEVAKKLQVSRTWLDGFLKEHPYYRLAGNRKRFSKADIQLIIEAMRAPEPAPRKLVLPQIQRRRRGPDCTIQEVLDLIDAKNAQRRHARRRSNV